MGKGWGFRGGASGGVVWEGASGEGLRREGALVAWDGRGRGGAEGEGAGLKGKW